MPAQLMFGNSDVNACGSGLPLVALRSSARQTSMGSIPRLLARALRSIARAYSKVGPGGQSSVDLAAKMSSKPMYLYQGVCGEYCRNKTVISFNIFAA
jgi:hypothetical protein